MERCHPAKSPLRSGLVINRIPLDLPLNADGTQRYQSLIGALNWLSGSMRPGISVTLNLLSQFSHSPHEGHWESVRYVFRYLAGFPLHGVRFCEQRASTLHSFAAWLKGEGVYTAANWDPQDALQPSKDPAVAATQMVSVNKCRSLCGWVVTRCAGLVLWGIIRIGKVACSLCEAEIMSTDERCKFVKHHWHVLAELECADVSSPTPMFNDNEGAISWSGSQLHKRMRHFNIRESAICNCWEARTTAVESVPGEVNPADLFTKEQQDVNHFVFLWETLMSLQ